MISVDNLEGGYVTVAQTLLEQGELVVNRRTNSRLVELRDLSIRVADPSRVLPLGTGRKVNPALAAAEAIQLVGGWSDPPLLGEVARNTMMFRDAGVFHASYGVRIREQMRRVVKILHDDPTTRQAVVTIWEPIHDQDGDTNDTPCTVCLQFMVRDDRLELHTHMRSNDVYWGLTYDAFQFTQLQLTVAAFLGLAPGPYFHHAVSFHAYERDWAAIRELHQPEGEQAAPWGQGLFEPGCPTWQCLQAQTLKMLHQTPLEFYGTLPMPRSGRVWYYKQLRPRVEALA